MTIEFKNVTKKFKDITILKDINLVFESGNIYGLFGRNGSGKSVFLKLLCGFYTPSEGEILYNGENLNKKLEFPPNTRALIEKPSFFPDLTGLENLKFLAEIQNKITDKEINDTLEFLSLDNEKNKKYSKYSLGMKQKLGIAQVLMENPDVIVLDEPFNGVENVTVLKIIDYLKEEAQKGKLIFISTHIMEDLEKLTDKIYYFDDGAINEKK